jgi:hypothetical protein
VGRAAGTRQALRVVWFERARLGPVIWVEETTPPLSPDERFGLDTLIDASRVLPVHGDNRSAGGVVADLVTLRIADERGIAGNGAGRDVASELAAPYDVGDGVITVSRARLRAVADVAGAAVEQRSSAADTHGRIPSSHNPLVAYGREREPIVSSAATALRTAVSDAAGRRPVLACAPWPNGRQWAAAFTHDIDVVAAWPVFTALRLAELGRKGHVRAMGAVAAAALAHAARDPVGSGVRAVLDIERQSGIESTWFALCGTPTWSTFRHGDLTYRPESRHARAVLGAVRAAGHELGLHGSFATGADARTFAAQRERLGRLIGSAPRGVRQHFLKMRPGATQRAMAAADFTYDATFGFPDRNGFRLGAADVMPGWDAASQSATPLAEVPLIWMDRAQSKYQGVEDPARWVDDALELAATCRRVGGLWVGLWHPNLTAPLGFPGALEAYDILARSIVSDEPYVAPLERMVAWRRLRGAIRVVGLDGDAVTLEAPARRAFEVGILDGAGAVVHVLPRDDGGSTGTVRWDVRRV